MDSQPSSSSERPQRKRKPNTKFDIEDTISIPVKSQRKDRKKTPSTPSQSASKSASQSSNFWPKSPNTFLGAFASNIESLSYKRFEKSDSKSRCHDLFPLFYFF